jgi:hypothetical protein
LSTSLFSMPRMQKMRLHCLSTLWNITLSTSQKKVFEMVRKHI